MVKFYLNGGKGIFFKYNRLGTSGLQVCELSLGSYLTFGDKIGEKESIQTIHKAFELGINSFDTANVYQNGEAERVAWRLQPGADSGKCKGDCRADFR
ncbi:aldo/keto reductase [Ectobacillus ponti]|uniref:Aldo/keto reductase n=1 Tax=Ectobacillus ponti TaxID=2961894 RepID=A0AA41XAU2_9BACI|nr:aldo/keto reductase [Ectobacillus ponti]MCP8970085.1 aldo/keto reductase [Ectobacillus ponti]